MHLQLNAVKGLAVFKAPEKATITRQNSTCYFKVCKPATSHPMVARGLLFLVNAFYKHRL